MTEPLLREDLGAIAYLTLNRPEAGNAIDLPLARALSDAAEAAAKDPAIRCVVLRGNGRMFCAGGDVKKLHCAGERLPHLLGDILAHLHRAIACLLRMDKPVITAVQGPAAGAGLGIAVCGDIVLAAPEAHFTMAYSRIGLTPDGGASWLLPRLIGLRRTQELALTNRSMPAAEAAAVGLVTRVVDQGELTDATNRMAETLASGATRALGQTRTLFLDGYVGSLEAQLASEAETIIAQGRNAESHEGLTALIERRAPDFVANGRV